MGAAGNPSHQRRLALVSQETLQRINAITDYTRLLADACTRAGLPADVILRTEVGRFVRIGAPHETGGALRGQTQSYEAVLLQYNPFMYGRWGFAPWLPVALLRLRRASPRPLIGLMVHEPCVDMVDWRSCLMGLWQRLQLAAMVRISDALFVSVDVWTPYLRGRRRSTPIFHLPVGSNLPDRRASRAAERKRLGVVRDGVVLAILGTGHPAHLSGHTVAAANTVARSHQQVILLNLGDGAPQLSGLDASVTVHRPGRVAVGVLADLLSAADVFLAPFVDGVSSRRTSVIAALQHGLPVVGTEGPSTDKFLRPATDALSLLPAGACDAFADAVRALATHEGRRLSMSQAARQLYEDSFDWQVLATRLIDDLRIVMRERLTGADEARLGAIG